MRCWPRLVRLEAHVLPGGRIAVSGTGPLRAIGPVVLREGAAPSCSHAAQSAMEFLCAAEELAQEADGLGAK